MPTPDVTTDILVALGTGVVLLFLAKFTDKGKTGDGADTPYTPPYLPSDVQRVYDALDMFVKLPIPSEQSQIDALQVGVARLIKSAQSNETTEKVNRISDMAAEAMYDVLKVKDAFANEDFFNTSLDITEPLARLGESGKSLQALTSAQLDTVLGEVVKMHKDIAAALLVAGTTIEPRDAGSPSTAMESAIGPKRKAAIEAREKNYGDERIVTQLLPVTSVEQLVAASMKGTMSTIFGDIDTLKHKWDTKANTYFVVASTDPIDLTMLARYWSEDTVINYDKDALKFHGGFTGTLIDPTNAVHHSGVTMKYRDVVTVGTGTLDKVFAHKGAKKSGSQVWLHMWEVPKTDIKRIDANPPATGPHPWEYAFKRVDQPALKPDQLTFMWDTMAARGLTNDKHDIIRLLDHDMFAKFIANFE